MKPISASPYPFFIAIATLIWSEPQLQNGRIGEQKIAEKLKIESTGEKEETVTERRKEMRWRGKMWAGKIKKVEGEGGTKRGEQVNRGGERRGEGDSVNCPASINAGLTVSCWEGSWLGDNDAD